MPTIKDIAHMAGVSAATVSRVLNGKGEASKETSARITEIANAMGYRPNALARSLVGQRSDLIAIMIPNLTNPFFSELVTSIEAKAEEKGFHVLICDTNDKRSRVEYFLGTIVENRAFGAIICTQKVTGHDLAELEKNNIRTVTIDRTMFNHPFSSIDVDQFEGTYCAVRHLIERRARRIVFLAGPENDVMSESRERGYTAALRSASLTYSAIWHGDYTMESGRNIVHRAWDSGEHFDGIFTANDLMAVGVLRACYDTGVVVPDELHLVSNDDIDCGDFIHPRLTSLSQQRDTVSTQVIEELMRLRNDPDQQPRHIKLKPQLIVRQSA